MDFKDYYEIVGVPATANEKTIRQAYHQLARKHHPDVNPDNKEAEERFKTINEANQVLSDTKQRKKYDELWAQYQQWQKKDGRKEDFDWQNWSAFRVRTWTAGASQQNEGEHMQNAPSQDFFGSVSPYSDFFFGRGKSWGDPPSRPVQGLRLHRGLDVKYKVNLTPEEAFQGVERLVDIDGHRIKAGIPPGMHSGSRVRLAGQGEPGQNGSRAGDLYLFIQVLPRKTCERTGDDLHMDAPVGIFTAIMGAESTSHCWSGR